MAFVICQQKLLKPRITVAIRNTNANWIAIQAVPNARNNYLASKNQFEATINVSYDQAQWCLQAAKQNLKKISFAIANAACEEKGSIEVVAIGYL